MNAPTPTGPAGPTDPLAAFAALRTPEGTGLLAALRDHDPAQELATATRLRRTHPADLVSAALGQARLRQRAVAKFGAEDAYRMFFTPNGVEQATRTSVAAHRAGRFASLGVRSVADLCCGIGGDAIALARAGIRVLAVDRDPLTAEVARANAEALGLADLVEVRCADVTEIGTAAYDAVFVDPARRGGRGRIFDPEAYSPPLSWATAAALKAPRAALKIAPGIPHEAIGPQAEAEWISDGGDVKEAVLWFGEGFTAGSYRATLLPSAATLTAAAPAARPAGRPGRPLSVRAGRRGHPCPSGRRHRGAVRRAADRRDDRVHHERHGVHLAVHDGLRDHRPAPVRDEEAEGPAAGAGGRRTDRQEARFGRRTGGAAAAHEAPGAACGHRVPDPGGRRSDDADRPPRRRVSRWSVSGAPRRGPAPAAGERRPSGPVPPNGGA
ncbi:hypothetical protein ACVWXU_003972 [Streptomyces sp. TE33382]